MDYSSKDTASSHSAESSTSKKLRTGAWGIPLARDACHPSNDASLFSSSLPVLPHEQCMYKL
uniref:Protein MEI2-like 2 n=1 Tax=Rhizophora mucronata TaxID=61149 RepID=A0A2P2LG81_RHIMU